MRYLKTHYDPFANPSDEESWSETGICGTYLNDGNSTNDKDLVSCKKCIKRFDKADAEVLTARLQELKDMQGFVDFMNETKNK
ncbi:hypothetical protein [Chryseobacterium sediminis]|uniref:Uncharacterized protein n=1 Tax=Chryseobacterium sediminis TaxID=1679494 RepID=A0A5B2U8Z4_9FLAO|nr:hypothetical protein [Chryseobacterium sediminis]KAA2223012.1 hypothetical protein FW780_02070 [Chryseobacterium sediminis]